MISKYNGVCSYCKLPTKAGQDHYDIATKASYHSICEEGAESGEPGPDAYAIADRLGYRHFSWLYLQPLHAGIMDERERPDCPTPERTAVRDVCAGITSEQEY